MHGRPSSPSVAREPVPPTEYSRSASIPLVNESLSLPPDPNKTLQKRRSYDDRPLNVLAQQSIGAEPPGGAANGLLAPEGGTMSRKEKRRSINPGLVMSFNKPSGDAQEKSFTAPSTPRQNGERPQSPTALTHKQDVARATSPLREHFPGNVTTSPPSYIRDLDTNKSQPSHLPRMQLDTSHVATQDRPHFGRSRSASSSDQQTLTLEQGRSNSPVRLSVTLDRVPARTSSRPENRSDTADGGRRTPQLATEGRSSPSLNVPGDSSISRQRSFEGRQRNSTSSLGQMMEAPYRAGSRPTSPAPTPTSPSHHVDVPHGIESGTDTDAEGDEEFESQNPNVRESLPPLPPPKESKGPKVGTRPPNLKLDTTQVDESDRGDISQVDSEDISEEFSHEELVESTSHSTYIAPALPPIRFSVVGGDFADIFSKVQSEESRKGLDDVPEGKENLPKLDVTVTPPPTAASGPRTPTSDQTNFNVDATPVQRRDPNSARTYSLSPANRTPNARQANTNGFTDLSQQRHELRPTAEVSMLRSVSSPEPRDHAARNANGAVRGRDRQGSDASIVPHAATDDRGHTKGSGSSLDTNKATPIRPEISDIVVRRLREALQDSHDRGTSHIKLDTELVSAILALFNQRQEEYNEMKRKLDGMKVSNVLPLNMGMN